MQRGIRSSIVSRSLYSSSLIFPQSVDQRVPVDIQGFGSLADIELILKKAQQCPRKFCIILLVVFLQVLYIITASPFRLYRILKQIIIEF